MAKRKGGRKKPGHFYVEDDVMAQNDINNRVIIQDEIRVPQSWIDEKIADYEEMPSNYHLSFGDFSGNKDDIIREIKNLTKYGKDMLMMSYRFEDSEFGKKALAFKNKNKRRSK